MSKPPPLLWLKRMRKALDGPVPHDGDWFVDGKP